MARDVNEYLIEASTSFEDACDTFNLALVGTAAIHGELDVRLGACYFANEFERTIVIDTSTPVGCTLNRLFLGYAIAEFGPDAVKVNRRRESDGDPLGAAA